MRISLVVLLGLLLATPVVAQTRGYVPRACGFDIDHDGVVGEAGDCDKLCSGASAAASVANPAGGNWTQKFVDCDSGNDSNAGTSAAPYKTITHALTQAPGSGNSLTVCFTGTCTAATGETFPLEPVGGQTGNYTRTDTPSGGAFSYPTKPAMLVGWDEDGDGCYPPEDDGSGPSGCSDATADVAVIDGTDSVALAAHNAGGVSNVEWAHFTAKRFGTSATTASGFYCLAGQCGGSREYGGSVSAYVTMHDLHLIDILRGRKSEGLSEVFNLFISPLAVHHQSFQNLYVPAFGSIFVRGGSAGGGNGEPGPFRFAAITATAIGSSGNPITSDQDVFAFKVWDQMDGFEVLDCSFDAQPRSWSPCPGGQGSDEQNCQPTYFFDSTGCLQNITIRHNVITDFKEGITIMHGGACTTRSTGPVVIDQNEIVDTWDGWYWGDFGMYITGGDSGDYINGLTVTNNIIRSTDGMETYYLDSSWSGNTSAFIIANNTFDGDSVRYGGSIYGQVMLGDPETAGAVTGHPAPEFRNNIFSNTNAPACLRYSPSSDVWDSNVFPTGTSNLYTTTDSRYCATKVPFSTFATATGATNSRQCAASFVSSTDLHLASNDTCALDYGATVASVTTDYDNQARSGTYDIGADEYQACHGAR